MTGRFLIESCAANARVPAAACLPLPGITGADKLPLAPKRSFATRRSITRSSAATKGRVSPAARRCDRNWLRQTCAHGARKLQRKTPNRISGSRRTTQGGSFFGVVQQDSLPRLAAPIATGWNEPLRGGIRTDRKGRAIEGAKNDRGRGKQRACVVSGLATVCSLWVTRCMRALLLRVTMCYKNKAGTNWRNSWMTDGRAGSEFPISGCHPGGRSLRRLISERDVWELLFGIPLLWSRLDHSQGV